MILIDTHAHIYLPEFSEDLGPVISASKNAGVQKIFMPNVDSNTLTQMLEVSNKYPDYCYSMIGLHPCSVNNNYREELDIIETWIAKQKFYGIGETGIDLFWDKTYYDLQVQSLEFQILMAKKHNLPIILHSRNSMDETISVIRKYAGKDLTGIFHCFSGDSKQAAEIIEMGFLLGIGGVVTFKNSKLDVILKALDISRIVLETDSPYLAPVPFRGKRNDPSKLTLVVARLAEIYQLKPEEIADRTTQNALKLFRLTT